MNVSISRNGAEIGEWPEEEVRSLYKEGQLLPTDHYWKEGMSEWKELRTFLKPPPPAAKPAPVSPLKKTERIKESGANQLDPIIINADNYVVSAAIQEQILDEMFKKIGFDKRQNQRLYKESSLGSPGNKDLCQTIVTLNNGTVVSVWFDLSIVSSAENKKEKDLVENQVVIDRSETIEPTEELQVLNNIREGALQLPPLGPIKTQTQTIEQYGTSTSNPITVTGLLGLAAYVKSLRFQRFNSAIIATYKCSMLLVRDQRSSILDEYPVDCFDVSCGTFQQLLVFRIYGLKNDTIYPKNFYRIPFDGKYDFKLSKYLKFPQMGYLDGITKEGVVTCAFLKQSNGQLQVLLNNEKIWACPWQELSAHSQIFGKLL